MRALILSAGKGARLQPLTWFVPKPLVRVARVPIIKWVMQHLMEYGITEFAVNISYKPMRFLKTLGSKVLFYYEPEPLGTAGTVKALADWLGDTFVVVMGDTISNPNIDVMLKCHERTESLITVFTKDTLVHNGGTYIFSKKIKDSIPDGFYLIPDLISLVGERATGYCENDAYYFDCGTFKKLRKARRAFRGIEKS